MDKRIVGLDVIRVVSALVICAFHTVIHLGCDYGILQLFLRNGAVLMTTFFILSGFALAISNGETDLSNIIGFYKKRAISILPLYYLCAIAQDVMMTAYTAFFAGGVQERLEQVLFLAPIEAVGMQSIYVSLFDYNHNGGTWFISCLIICYLLYPLLICVVKKNTQNQRVIIAGILAAFCVYSSYIAARFNLASLYSNPAIRFCEFAIGVNIGSIWLEKARIKTSDKANIMTLLSATVIMAVGVSMSCKIFRYDDYMMFSWLIIPLSILLIYNAAQIKKWRFHGVIKYLSGLSYSFFLAQLFSNTICRYIITHTQISSNAIKIFLGWLTCVLIAVFLHHIIEIPVATLLKKKFII